MSWEKDPRAPDGAGLSCPICNSQRLRVIDSRAHAGTIRRRRECKNKHRFWTAEVWSDINAVGVSDEQRQAALEDVIFD